jgi:hypothetical protein
MNEVYSYISKSYVTLTQKLMKRYMLINLSVKIKALKSLISHVFHFVLYYGLGKRLSMKA